MLSFLSPALSSHQCKFDLEFQNMGTSVGIGYHRELTAGFSRYEITCNFEAEYWRSSVTQNCHAHERACCF